MQSTNGSRAQSLFPVSIIVTASMTYGILRFASSIGGNLGQRGLNVLQWIIGLVLAAIAMQFLVDEIGTVLPSLAGAIRVPGHWPMWRIPFQGLF
jgi:small neutral amino acid transporter SnatA (MarC family)